MDQNKPQYGFQGVQPPIHHHHHQQPIHHQPGSAPPGMVYVTTAQTAAVVNVGPSPSHITCPSCRAQILTRIDYESTTKTHVAALILCCFVCWPCAWIPYVMDSCKNANHYCPSCNSYIGTYKN